MSGIARSQRLIAFYATAAGLTVPFICPAGHVTLVKAATFWNGGTATFDVEISSLTPDLLGWHVLAKQTLAPSSALRWEGFEVLNPNDQVRVVLGGIGLSVWVSGAILAGPNQFPPSGQPAAGSLPA